MLLCVCVDINECADVSDESDETEASGPCINARCINTPGSYRCQCTELGTTLDSTGTTCRGQSLC